MRDFRHELAACFGGCSVPSRMTSLQAPCWQLFLVLIQPEDFQFSAFGTAFSVVFVRVDRAVGGASHRVHVCSSVIGCGLLRVHEAVRTGECIQAVIGCGLLRIRPVPTLRAIGTRCGPTSVRARLKPVRCCGSLSWIMAHRQMVGAVNIFIRYATEKAPQANHQALQAIQAQANAISPSGNSGGVTQPGGI